MRTVTITVGTGAQGVTIGRRAENEATAVIFDVSALIETYGDGSAVLMVKRPTDADAYPATVERSGASVTWTPTETDLAYKGMGEAELFWYVDGMLAKTAVYTINIRRDIGETTGEAPAPYDDWIATLTELGGQTAENAQRAEVARAAAETAAATAASAANTANTAAERAESAANNAEQDAASTAADRTAAEDAAARAATSATAAATSASVAETSATQAGLSANSAAASATSAAQSASDAQSAVASIGDSVTRAESAATTAQSAATTASTKAAEANTSAGTAAQNATTATVKAQEAAQSATQAAQSATSAQTAQTAAEAAQTAAETAAASAEAQADRAEGYADRLIDVYPTDTASGSIASFPDGADSVEIKSAVVQIVPVQDLHGYDNPWPAGGGKNVLNPKLYTGMTYNPTVGRQITFVESPIQFSTSDNKVFTFSTTSTWTSLTMIAPIDPSQTYGILGTFSSTETLGVSRVYLDADMNVLATYNSRNNPQSDSGGAISIPANAAYYCITITNASTAVTTITVDSPMLALTSNDSTTYAPYKNICPISGWTGANVTAAGKNLLKLKNGTYPVAGTTATVSDGTISISGISTSGGRTNRLSDVFLLKAGTYKITHATVSPAISLCLNKASDNTLLGSVLSASITITEDTLVYVGVTLDAATYSGESIKPMIEVGSTASAYEPYAGRVIPITWQTEAGTVYGGTLTYDGDGVWTVTSDMVMFDLGTLQYQQYNEIFYSTTGPLFGNGGAAVINSGNTGDYKCDIYSNETVQLSNPENGRFFITNTYESPVIRISDNRFASVDDFVAAVQGVKCAVRVKTPTTYTLTTEQVVNTLKGQNNIWSDTGDMSVEYRADIQLYLDKKLAALAAALS